MIHRVLIITPAFCTARKREEWNSRYRVKERAPKLVPSWVPKLGTNTHRYWIHRVMAKLRACCLSPLAAQKTQSRKVGTVITSQMRCMCTALFISVIKLHQCRSTPPVLEENWATGMFMSMFRSNGWTPVNLYTAIKYSSLDLWYIDEVFQCQRCCNCASQLGNLPQESAERGILSISNCS